MYSFRIKDSGGQILLSSKKGVQNIKRQNFFNPYFGVNYLCKDKFPQWTT